jgi:hypothetical protein
MRWHWIIVMISCLWCAACSPLPPVTEPPFYTATPRPTGSAPLTTNNPRIDGTNVPTRFQSDRALTINLPGTAALELTTDTSAITVEDATIVYNYVQRVGTGGGYDQIFISYSDAQRSRQIVFTFASGLDVGTYLVTTPTTRITSGIITAQYSELGSDGADGTRLNIYDQAVEGTLTLTEAGATIAGVFTFRAGRADTDETISIAGQFSDVPYSRRDDPFAVPLIEPTQATPEYRP